MAARTVHCFFKNLTDETLVREREHLDHGVYTDPWFPPSMIAPGAVAEWRTESSGFLTGTEGRARYRIAADDGTEFIDLWWDNPFVGGNKSSIAIVEDFSGKPSRVFEGANHIDGAPPPNLVKMSDGDVEAWIDAVLFPPYVFANAPVANDANAVFAVRRRQAAASTPLFGPHGTGRRSSRINISGDPVEWEGLWTSRAVAVAIFRLDARTMTACVTDTTANPALQIQESFTLGRSGWALNAFALATQREFGVAGGNASAAVIRAAARTILAERPAELDRVTAMIRESVNAELGEHAIEVPEVKLRPAIAGAAAAALLPRATVTLSHGACLTLYDDFEDGRKVDAHMLYERLASSLGPTLASERLRYNVKLG